MTAAALITLATIGLSLLLLIKVGRDQDVILWGAVAFLVLVPLPSAGGWEMGVITIKEAFSGLANEGIVTIAFLFVVSASVRETGALRLVLSKILGRPRSLHAAQHRIVWPTALFSCLLNNTPLVTMLLPFADEWAKRLNLSSSKLLMPLSFASILGGACTLIGTSTNLIVNGWLIDFQGSSPLQMFTITPLALPLAIAGLVVSIFASRWLLPVRKPAVSTEDDARQYTVEMIVQPGGDLVNKSVEQAGLRGLPGLFLIEIERDGESLPAVSGNVLLRSNDRLVFAGVVDSVIDLQKINGLLPATNQVFKLDKARHNRTLIEAVVSDSCPLVGRSIREGRFRTHYNAAVIAVARNGERINKKIGDIILRAGDTLLLEARRSFAEQQRNSRDFYLISSIDNSNPPHYERAPVALAVLFVMVVAVTTGVLTMLQAAMLATAVLLLTGCCSPAAARGAVDWQVLLVIAAALAMGTAMEKSGLSTLIGHGIIAVFRQNEIALLAAIFGLTAVFSCLVTSKTAAVLMLPIAAAAAAELNINILPLVIAVMFAAATAVASPLSYPTNLMVFGPGGYRFVDYVRFGLPVTLIMWVGAVILIPWLWPMK